MSPFCQAPHQPVTLLSRHPISFSPYSPRHPISLILSHSHPISLSSYFTHPISLSPYLTHPISPTPYLTLTLSVSHPVCPGGDGGDAGAGAGAIPHRDGHGAGAAPRPEGQPAGASERAQTNPRRGNSLACKHVSSRFVTLRHACVSVFFLRFVALLNDHFPAMKKNVIEIYILYFIENVVYSPC